MPGSLADAAPDDIDGPRDTFASAPNVKAAGIRDALHGAAHAGAEVDTFPRYDDHAMELSAGTLNPLQLEMLEDGSATVRHP